MNKGKLIGIGVFVVLILSGGIIWQDSQLSSAAQAESAQEARNTELQKKVESLEQEVAALKETADYYFQQGVDQQTSGNLQEAKTEFEAVITKFPTSNLVGSAQQRLAAVNEAIAKAEANRLEEEKQRQEYGKRSVWAVWTGLLLVGILPSGHSGGVHLEDRWMLAMPQ